MAFKWWLLCCKTKTIVHFLILVIFSLFLIDPRIPCLQTELSYLSLDNNQLSILTLNRQRLCIMCCGFVSICAAELSSGSEPLTWRIAGWMFLGEWFHSRACALDPIGTPGPQDLSDCHTCHTDGDMLGGPTRRALCIGQDIRLVLYSAHTSFIANRTLWKRCLSVSFLYGEVTQGLPFEHSDPSL